jgi:hypothetical protein
LACRQEDIENQRDVIEEVKPDLKEGNKHVLRRSGNHITPDGEFLIQIADEGGIRNKVQTLIALWKHTREEHDQRQASKAGDATTGE